MRRPGRSSPSSHPLRPARHAHPHRARVSAGRRGHPASSPPLTRRPLPRHCPLFLLDGSERLDWHQLAPPQDDQEEPGPPADTRPLSPASDCDRPPHLGRRASQVRSGTHRQVPESNGNPRISPEVCAEAPKSRANKIPANSPLSVSNVADASLDRTQEVGGSSPPSSISRTPAVEPNAAPRAGRELSAWRAT